VGRVLTYRAYRTELRPNRNQEDLLRKHCGAARYAYNWGLARRIDEYERTGRVLTSVDLHRELNKLKRTELAWLYEVSKCAPHEALRDLDRAFGAFFEGRKRHAGWPGFPTFKKRRYGTGSFRLNGIIRIGDKWIQLPRLGRLRLKESGYVPPQPEHLLSATVTERAGRWFVSVRVVEQLRETCDGPAVGVDLGLERLATTSDGEIYPNPRTFRRFERKVRRLQRRVQRRQKGSRNRGRARAKLARVYLRLSNIRSDNLNKVTTRLAKTKSVIVVETLAVGALQRSRRVSRGLADAGLRQFRTMLEYKTTWYGSTLRLAPRMFASSQICSACGEVNRGLTLSDRTFQCPACAFRCDRDLNAARNLLAVAGSSSETRNACGAGSAGRRTPVKLPAANQELSAGSENGKVIGVQVRSSLCVSS
jgi:putative transposase